MKTRRHRLITGLNAGMALLLAAVAVLMVNYLSFRYFYREDFSSARRYALSPRTAGLLESLESRVNVTVFFQPGNVLYEDIHNLLREYQFHSRLLNIQWVDPDRDLALTEEMAVRYQVSEPNVVVFESAGRSKYVRADEIATIDASSGVERITLFKGEQAFSSAILAVVKADVPTVYFLTGHGERDILDFDRRTGFSGAARLIERDNVEVKQLLLSAEQRIPDDCAALVIAGASQSMSRAEADLIHSWLRRGGRLMVLADAGKTSGLEPVLAEWGVILRDDVVLDPARTLTGREVFISSYNSRHPVTARLGSTAAILHRPRSVWTDAAAGPATADRPQAVPLAFSSKSGWSETQWDQSPARYDEGTDDLPGPVPLAAAVEKGGSAGPLDVQIRPSRMVVFGDSGFISNGGLTGGDISLFMSALNWLLDREELLAIAPRQVEDARLKLTRQELSQLFWVTTGVIPGGAMLLGMGLWFRRRK